MILRLARPEEFAEVGEVTLAAYVADGFLERDEEYAEELRAASHRAENAELVVAVDRDSHAVVGTVTFCRPGSPYAEISRPGEAEFRMLAVTPSARGRGVGEMLVRWCVDRAREQGCDALALSSLDRMTDAHRLYERMGFERAPERDWEPVDGIRLLAYRLDLRP
ncbi:MAG TPA: GNAT family N-acetyltransferase [Actinomycetes bacterium]